MYYVYIDEAGRGPIAGPVTVWCVLEEVSEKPWLDWFTSVSILGLKKKRGVAKVNIDSTLYDYFPARHKSDYKNCDDSKALSPMQREEVYAELLQNKHIIYHTESVSAKNIDDNGIMWCLREGVLHGLHNFFVGWKYDFEKLQKWLKKHSDEVVLVVDWPYDFWLSAVIHIPIVPVIDGDAKIPMISAASIFAKVDRDAYMRKLGEKDHRYWFENHKWYWTAAHYHAINEHGLHGEHRRSYIHDKQ